MHQGWRREERVKVRVHRTATRMSTPYVPASSLPSLALPLGSEMAALGTDTDTDAGRTAALHAPAPIGSTFMLIEDGLAAAAAATTSGMMNCIRRARTAGRSEMRGVLASTAPSGTLAPFLPAPPSLPAPGLFDTIDAGFFIVLRPPPLVKCFGVHVLNLCC